MKKKWLIVIGCIFLGLVSQAQLNKNVTSAFDSTAIKEKPAILFSEFTNSINPQAFQSSFAKEKKNLLKKTEKATTAPAMANSVLTLAKSVKPEMFNPNFNLSNLQALAKKAQTIRQATMLLKDLEAGLKPSAFTPTWKLRKTLWLQDVSKLK